MSKGPFVSDDERMVMRVGHAYGIPAAWIARYIGRTPQSIYKHISKMEADGTLGAVPADYIAGPLAEAMRKEAPQAGRWAAA